MLLKSIEEPLTCPVCLAVCTAWSGAAEEWPTSRVNRRSFAETNGFRLIQRQIRFATLFVIRSAALIATVGAFLLIAHANWLLQGGRGAETGFDLAFAFRACEPMPSCWISSAS